MIRVTEKSYCNLTRGGPGKDGVQIFQWDPPRIEYVIANRLLPEARGIEQYGSPMSADMGECNAKVVFWSLRGEVFENLSKKFVGKAGYGLLCLQHIQISSMHCEYSFNRQETTSHIPGTIYLQSHAQRNAVSK